MSDTNAETTVKRVGRPKLSEEEKIRRAKERMAKLTEQSEDEQMEKPRKASKSKITADTTEDGQTTMSIETDSDFAKNNEDGLPSNSIGEWNTDKLTVPENMSFMTIEIELLESALGTTPNNKGLLSDYIAKNAPTAELADEEVENLDPVEVFEKGTTIFPKMNFIRDSDGKLWDPLGISTPRDENNLPRINGELHKLPFFYDYQIRGGFKDACALLQRAAIVDENGKKVGTTESSKIRAFKKIIDGGVFVWPRRIPIVMPDYYLDDAGNKIATYDENGNLRILQRPLRSNGPSGERISLAASEVIPAGSRFKYTIGYTNKSIRAAIVEWLNYGLVHGVGQWRNSGKGIFRWRQLPTDMAVVSSGGTNFSESIDQNVTDIA